MSARAITSTQVNGLLAATQARKPSMTLWTYRKQQSVFKVGEVLVTLFAAEPPIELIYDLLVAV